MNFNDAFERVIGHEGGDFMVTLNGRLLFHDVWPGLGVISVDGTSTAI